MEQHVEEGINMAMNTDLDTDLDLEWEEWDGTSPFLHHCIAGSIAGVAEHVLLYPVDTVKTHMQAYCSTCPNNPANIASPNAATKAVCTGPPSAVVSQAQAVSHAVPQSQAVSQLALTSNAAKARARATVVKGVAGSSHGAASTATAAAPHGMWSTMSNLINYGHGHGHGYGHELKHAARQSGTLTVSLPHLETGASASSIKNNIQNNINITKGYARLWRGVQTMATGCIPAHALYFSSYEYMKSILSTTTTTTTTIADGNSTTTTTTELNTFGASIAGATSALLHDLVMTPMDTIKQRMQLGHYDGMGHALKQIIALEGWAGLYRSFGVTVMTNLPYGMVMVSTNEFLRNVLMKMKRDRERDVYIVDGDNNSGNGGRRAVLDLQSTMLAGCGAGMVAAAVTSPLDRVKTRLQTQKLLHSMPPSASTSASTSASSASKGTTAAVAVECPKARAITKAAMGIHSPSLSSSSPHYSGFNDALVSIVKEEGFVGLWRGFVPRLLTHTPAVAISWTSYEAAKRVLHEYA